MALHWHPRERGGVPVRGRERSHHEHDHLPPLRPERLLRRAVTSMTHLQPMSVAVFQARGRTPAPLVAAGSCWTSWAISLLGGCVWAVELIMYRKPSRRDRVSQDVGKVSKRTAGARDTRKRNGKGKYTEERMRKRQAHEDRWKRYRVAGIFFPAIDIIRPRSLELLEREFRGSGWAVTSDLLGFSCPTVYGVLVLYAHSRNPPEPSHTTRRIN